MGKKITKNTKKNCCNFQRLYINTEIELLRVFKTEPRLSCVHYTHTHTHTHTHTPTQTYTKGSAK